MRRCVIVTRPQPQADAWVAALTGLGQAALALPLLRVVAEPGFAPAVRQAWQDLARCGLVMFVSPNAVLSFMAHRPAGAAWPPGVLAAATGPGTVAALAAAGVPAMAVLSPRQDAERFDAEALWADALCTRDWVGRSVLVVRGDTGRDWLADTLRQAGALVQLLSAYRQQGPDWDALAQAGLAQVLAQPARHAWLFSSSRAIEHLMARLVDPACRATALAMAVLASHPRIAETARQAGFTRVQSVRPDVAEVARAVDRMART